MIIVELTWIKNASLENIDKFINTMYFYVDFFFDEKNLKVKRERGKEIEFDEFRGKSEEEEDRWLLSISSSFLFFRFHA